MDNQNAESSKTTGVGVTHGHGSEFFGFRILEAIVTPNHLQLTNYEMQKLSRMAMDENTVYVYRTFRKQ